MTTPDTRPEGLADEIARHLENFPDSLVWAFPLDYRQAQFVLKALRAALEASRPDPKAGELADEIELKAAKPDMYGGFSIYRMAEDWSAVLAALRTQQERSVPEGWRKALWPFAQAWDHVENICGDSCQGEPGDNDKAWVTAGPGHGSSYPLFTFGDLRRARTFFPKPCQQCAGEGQLYTSRYGGNDPDVWPTGTCPVCDGTGQEPPTAPQPASPPRESAREPFAFKERRSGFLSQDHIDHDSEVFDYTRELHEVLWRISRAVDPGASGFSLQHVLPDIIAKLEASPPRESEEGKLRRELNALAEKWAKDLLWSFQECAIQLREALSASEPPADDGTHDEACLCRQCCPALHQADNAAKAPAPEAGLAEEQNRAKGWTLDPSYLTEVQKEVEKATGEYVQWEGIEAVILADRRLRPDPASEGLLREALESAKGALEAVESEITLGGQIGDIVNYAIHDAEKALRTPSQQPVGEGAKP